VFLYLKYKINLSLLYIKKITIKYHNLMFTRNTGSRHWYLHFVDRMLERTQRTAQSSYILWNPIRTDMCDIHVYDKKRNLSERMW